MASSSTVRLNTTRQAPGAPGALVCSEEFPLPASYTIDSARRLVMTVVWGPATDDEVLDHGRQLRADPLFDPSYRQLADMSGVTEIRVSSSTIEQISRGQLFDPGTQRAFVASSDAIFGLLRKYELHADSHGQKVRVFRDRNAAEVWLGLR
jgi:hypothetical protein